MKDNELIAEFMGLHQNKEDNGAFKIGDWYNSEYRVIPKLLYNVSWDWLMPVVEKIESLALGEYGTSVTVDIRYERCTISTESDEKWTNSKHTKIEAVYASVVEFIEWYKEQPKP